MINVPKEKRSIFKELLAAALCSVFSGFGFIFLLMWGGLYL